MAPIHLLCGGLLKALLGAQPQVRKSKSSNKATSEDPMVMDVDTSDDEEITPKKSIVNYEGIKNEIKEESSKKQKKELETILNESDKWVNIIA